MKDDTHSNSRAKGQLFEQLADVRAGMLGIEGDGQHMQPMTHHCDEETGTLWFITSKHTNLVKAIGQGGTAHYCVTGKDHDYHACLRGHIKQSQDRQKLKELWSFVAAAWFEGGIDDPDICLLEMTLREASVWVSKDNAFLFFYEIAKATLQDHNVPDLGEKFTIHFA